MSTDEHPDDVPAQDDPSPVGADSGPAGGRSVLQELRERRETRAKASPRRLTLDIPGYGGRLAVIYGYPEDGYKRLAEAMRRGFTSDEKDARLNAAADIIVAATKSVIAKDEQGNPIDLLTDAILPGDSLPVTPLRFTSRLADALAIEVPEDIERKGRYIIRQVFSPQATTTGVYEGDLGIIAAGNQVYGFLSDADLDATEEFVGE